MAQYTTLSNQDFRQILALYGIHDIPKWKLLNGGSENTNFHIQTLSGEYVLTVCERKTLQTAQELADLLVYLAANNFKTSEIINTIEGPSVIIWQGKPILLKAYLHGEVLEDFPPHLLSFLGGELAKLHQITAPDYLPKKLAYGKECFEEMTVYSPQSDFHLWLFRLQKKIYAQPLKDLPKVLVHGDVFANNVIVQNQRKRTTIMDFEGASYYYRIFDIGMLLIGICGENTTLNIEKAKQIIAGYQAQIPLVEIEKNALQIFTAYAAGVIAFWRYRQYHILNPDPAFHDHYLTMKNLADNVLNLPKNSLFYI